MQKLRDFITAKRLYLLSVIMGGGAVLAWMLLTVSEHAISSMSGAGFLVVVLELVYFVSLAANVCLAAGAGLRLFGAKERTIPMIATFAVGIMGTLALLFNLRLVGLGFALLGGDYMAIIGAAMSLQAMAAALYFLYFAIILQVALAGYNIYNLLQLKKGKMPHQMGAPAPRFDPMTGQPIVTATQAAGGVATAAPPAVAAPGQTAQKLRAFVGSKKGKVTLGCIGGGILLLVAGGILLSVLTRTKLDLVSGVEVTFNNESGAGTAYVSKQNIDYDLNDAAVGIFVGSVTYQIEPSEGLANGDKVTVKAVYSKETAKKAKIKVTKDTRTFKVEGLTERYGDVADLPDEVIETSDAKSEKLIKNSYDSISYAGDFAYDKDKELVGYEKVAQYLMKGEPGGYDSDVYVALYKVTVKGQKKNGYGSSATYEDLQGDFYYYTEMSGIDSDFDPDDAYVYGTYFGSWDKIETQEQAEAEIEEEYDDYTIVKGA